MLSQNITEIELYDKQYRFVTSRKRYVAFVGGRGTGKSFAGCVAAFNKAMENPGSHGLITAPTYPQLRDSTKQSFLELVPHSLIAYKNDSENALGLYTPDGRVSHIHFRSTSDPDTIRGMNLLWVLMDEAAMSSEQSLKIIMGCLRAQPAEQQQIFVATTPRGHNWVYERFGPHVDDPDVEYFYATIDDNPYTPQEWKDDMKRQYSGSWAAQELEGKFTTNEGLIYGDLINYDVHVGRFPFVETRTVDLSWDFGNPKPEVAIAIQQDAEGNVYIIDEIYRFRTLTERVVEEARGRIWWPNVVDCIADEARPDNIQRLQNLGVPARASKKGNIIDGIAKVRSMFQIDPVTNKPILHIDRRCEMLIKELDQYAWATKRTESDTYIEKPIDDYNHALDALRYWVVTKWFPRSGGAMTALKNRPARRKQRWQLLDKSPFKY